METPQSTSTLQRSDEDVWAPFSHRGNSGIGVLVSHGFTAGPPSVIHLAKACAAAGHSVECPLLSGHGTRWQDVNKLTFDHWLSDLQEAMDRLKTSCNTVYVMGLSMGGTLVLRLAQLDPSIRGVVLINHALLFGNPLVPLARIIKHVLPSTPAIASDIKDPNEKEPAYARTPTGGVAELYRLTRLVKRGLPKLTQPMLIFKSREDHVLPLSNAAYTHDKVASKDKEIVWLEHSYHVATMDYDKDLIAERSLAFIQRLSAEH